MILYQVTLPLERETKGALLYRDQSLESRDPLYLLDGVYIRKAGMANVCDGTKRPESIKITIEST